MSASDIYTMEARLCDDEGMVSHAPVEPPNAFDADLTYYGQLNNLRRAGGHAAYEGDPFVCTGHAHLAGQHIRCISPAHQKRDWHGSYDGQPDELERALPVNPQEDE